MTPFALTPSGASPVAHCFTSIVSPPLVAEQLLVRPHSQSGERSRGTLVVARCMSVECLMPRRHHRVTSLALCVAALAAVGFDTVVMGETDRASATPKAPSIAAQSRFAVAIAATQAEIVQLVVDFEPGAWTSLHTHGGQAVNLVIEGEITLRQGGMDRPHKAGQSWTDSTGRIHAAGNTGPGKARLLTTLLLPKGAPLITVSKESRLGPTVTYEARFPLPPLPRDTEIVQQVIDLPPGWRMERAFHGFAGNLVMDGTVAYRIGSNRRPYKPGDAWMAQAGTVVTEEIGTPARMFRSHLVPKGAVP